MEVFTAIQAGGDRAWVKGVIKTHRRGRIRSSHKLQDRAVLMVSCPGSDQCNCPSQWRKGNFEKGHLLPLLMCFTTQFSYLILLDNEDFTLFFRWSPGILLFRLTSPRRRGGIISWETGSWGSLSETENFCLIILQ